MKFWGISNLRPGQSGTPGYMFCQLDRGIPLRHGPRRAMIWTKTPGFNLFLSVEPEKRKEAA